METIKRRHLPHTAPFEQIPLHDNDDDNNNNNLDEYDYEKDKLARHNRLDAKSQWSSQRRVSYTLVTLTLLSFWTRFRVISKPSFVIWDEAHFGKFGSYYLKREFFFDVHPPLGKMLVGLSGWLIGYDGSFGFDSASEYPKELNYSGMRLFGATWGALMVPLAYMSAHQLHLSKPACVLAAVMVLCDTAILCISRFILLDSMLMFFTCTSLYCLLVFHNTRDRPFSRTWWFWLSMTGLSLGLVSSVKWVGLFAVALVGFYTLEQLWDMFGDLQMPKRVYVAHWIARAICLIGIPAVVYVACFWAHFAVLTHSGPGDAHMSLPFQARLEGSPSSKYPFMLAYGSTIVLQSSGSGKEYLHSHESVYPNGTQQQQVTGYHHKDPNNDWILQPPHNAPSEEFLNEAQARFVLDGDRVQLMHEQTQMTLYTTTVPAPRTPTQFEMSCIKHGNASSEWIIERVQQELRGQIHTFLTEFRLRHAELGCLLTSSRARLPSWGFQQVEMTCADNISADDPSTRWTIAEHTHPALPPAPRDSYPAHFWQDFGHLNAAMWNTNNRLIPDPDKDDTLTSSPWLWPLASVGLRLCGWGDDNRKYFLLGNPIVWWSAAASLVSFIVACLTYNVRQRRHIHDLSPERSAQFYFGKTLFLGWFLHYMPFFVMGRVTYLHHYFPALYFAILLVPFLMDHFVPAHLRRWVFTTAFVAVIGAFVYFSPLAYGMEGPANAYSARRWLSSWRISD